MNFKPLTLFTTQVRQDLSSLTQLEALYLILVYIANKCNVPLCLIVFFICDRLNPNANKSHIQQNSANIFLQTFIITCSKPTIFTA